MVPILGSGWTLSALVKMVRAEVTLCQAPSYSSSGLLEHSPLEPWAACEIFSHLAGDTMSQGPETP